MNAVVSERLVNMEYEAGEHLSNYKANNGVDGDAAIYNEQIAKFEKSKSRSKSRSKSATEDDPSRRATLIKKILDEETQDDKVVEKKTKRNSSKKKTSKLRETTNKRAVAVDRSSEVTGEKKQWPFNDNTRNNSDLGKLSPLQQPNKKNKNNSIEKRTKRSSSSSSTRKNKTKNRNDNNKQTTSDKVSPEKIKKMKKKLSKENSKRDVENNKKRLSSSSKRKKKSKHGKLQDFKRKERPVRTSSQQQKEPPYTKRTLSFILASTEAEKTNIECENEKSQTAGSTKNRRDDTKCLDGKRQFSVSMTNEGHKLVSESKMVENTTTTTNTDDTETEKQRLVYPEEPNEQDTDTTNPTKNKENNSTYPPVVDKKEETNVATTSATHVEIQAHKLLSKKGGKKRTKSWKRKNSSASKPHMLPLNQQLVSADSCRGLDYRSTAKENRKALLRSAKSESHLSTSCESHILDTLPRHSVLGDGQFGEVWLVSTTCENGSLSYALKVQSKKPEETPAKADDDDVMAYYKREVEIMQRLDHPFINQLIHFQETESSFYMLLELVEGGELWSVMHSQDPISGEWYSGIAEDHAKFYGLVMADALSYMHKQNIIYRDLKPENVLIDKDGYPIIADFGCATYCAGKTYTFCGTPKYLAPEIIKNNGHGPGVDHWALGVLIYEMIVGENPFDSDELEHDAALFNSICKDDYFTLPEFVSLEAYDLIDCLLEKNPSQRIGMLDGGEEDILEHEWFDGLDLDQVRSKVEISPFIPADVTTNYQQEQ